MKLWFSQSVRSFVGPDGPIDSLVLLEVDLWTERKVTKTCPLGTVTGFLEGRLSETNQNQFDPQHSQVIKPSAEGWMIGRPHRKLVWASKVLISGSKVWVEDPKETE